ncbi:MAG: PilZ domain-containing protein [Candidatus Aminicenantes bacterium]|nr:MAG: PilZ domain-containing protein [Candidatus Aminicenantes bacterium]
MAHNKKERRRFIRFKIPGATVDYSQRFFFFSSIIYSEDFCPVVDICRGGIQFLSRRHLKSAKKILVKIYISDEESHLNLIGRIRWSFFEPFGDYNYQVGIQFEPFGGRKLYNQSQVLDKLVSLEKKFMAS